MKLMTERPSPAENISGALSRPPFVCLLLAVATLLVFWPVKNDEFITYDDPEYVTHNPHVRQGLTVENIGWAFRAGYASNWHPLTWLSHMLDAELFGADPAGPHLVNLLFHIANTLLLFLILRQLTGAHWRSAFVAALFALHPMHVESVAWISERKDVLSAFFGLAAIWAYAKYATSDAWRVTGTEQSTSPPVARLSSRFYQLALLFFALGLMAKPMLVTLPFVLLLLDYWPLARISNFEFRISNFKTVFLQKIPFFTLSAISCIITILAQNKSGALETLHSVPAGLRIENAVVSCVQYLGKLFWPVNLALPYPLPKQLPAGEILFAAILLAGCCVGVVWFGRRQRHLITGWFWFLGMLVPVIGLVQVGTQSMADRYTYLPFIGLFILLAWAAETAFTRWRIPKIATAIVALLILGACAARTVDQIGYWQNSDRLFRHTLAVTKDNWQAWDNLGIDASSHGRAEDALTDFRNALEINHADFVACNNIGFYYYRHGRLDDAMAAYQQALQLNPRHASAWNNLGSALAARREFADAIRCYEAALKVNPDFPDAHINLGAVLDETGRTSDAIHEYQESLRLAPDNAQAHNNLANTLAGEGRVDEAIEHYRVALQLKPDFVEAWNNLGWVLASKGKLDDAVACYENVLQLKPDHALAHFNLGNIFLKMNRTNDAIAHYAEALRLKPDYEEARKQLRALEQKP